MKNSLPKPVSANEFGEMRRDLIGILRALDSISNSKSRKGFCQWINDTNNDGLIPDHIADLMHLIRKFRNRAEYRECFPEGEVACAIRHAWAAIEDWRLQQCVVHSKVSGGDLPQNGHQL